MIIYFFIIILNGIIIFFKSENVKLFVGYFSDGIFMVVFKEDKMRMF